MIALLLTQIEDTTSKDDFEVDTKWLCEQFRPNFVISGFQSLDEDRWKTLAIQAGMPTNILISTQQNKLKQSCLGVIYC